MKSVKMLENFDPNSIQDIDGAREAIVRLFNLVENLKQENQQLREENQRLRDENQRLKGEQGKPKIKASRRPKKNAQDHSSERERRQPKPRQKRSKVASIRIDREQVLRVDPEQLPPDAEFKGHEAVIVQDIKVKTDNVCFLKEKYYSSCERQTYLAALPAGYTGEFGPGLKSLAIVLYFGANMTGPKILEFFHNVGVQISSGQLSNFLIKDHADFHAEKDSLFEAGLRSSPWQHIDDTGTRVNGQNQHCQILCNPLYTAYFTTEHKDRLTILDVIQNYPDRTYRLNSETYQLLQTFRLPAWMVRRLKTFPQDRVLSEAQFLGLLETQLPDSGPQQRRRVLEAAGVAAYHVQSEFPVVRLLVCDDARQFKWLTDELALCWIHEGRHYNKLTPFVPYHRQLLDKFRQRFWRYYEQLRAYQTHPAPTEQERLAQQFDELFSTVTGYDVLDERIAKTNAKKHNLLQVLDHPEIPLHNNPAELGARQRVRKRKISFGPRTVEGTQAWDTFMTLAATAKKLGISFYTYIYDRVSRAYHMPSLAELITQQAQAHQLAASWEPP
jgi:regulator of replication initiation timing